MSITRPMSEMNGDPWGYSAVGHRCFHCGQLLFDPAMMWNGADGQSVYFHPGCFYLWLPGVMRDVSELLMPASLARINFNPMGPMSPDREIMTLEEAADFLRMSRSTLYQRQDIPRHRIPGSRQYRYLRSELVAWLKGEILTVNEDKSSEHSNHTTTALEVECKPIYHRNPRYR